MNKYQGRIQMPFNRSGLRLLAALAALSAAQAFAQSSPTDSTRTSHFQYKPNGVLEKETVEKDLAGACVTTAYDYDAWGNKSSATTSGERCAAAVSFATRRSQTLFENGGALPRGAAPGQFPYQVKNALGHTETRETDPRNGVVLALSGPNGLKTEWELDDFGRKVLEKQFDAGGQLVRQTRVRYCLLVGSDLSSNSAGCAQPAGYGAPPGAASYVYTQVQDRNGLTLAPASWVYSDRAGRTLREVSEGFDGGTQQLGKYLAKDTVYKPNGSVQSQTLPYFLGSSPAGSTTTRVDALGRPIEVSRPESDVSGGTITAVSRIEYNGLVTTTFNAKNHKRVEEKNPEGKLARVTDAHEAQIAYRYDAFGNLIETRDALQNSVRIGYDLRGRKTSMADPDSGVWGYCYNELGELVAQQSQKQRGGSATLEACPAPGQGNPAKWTLMAYDALGRMTQRHEAEAIGSWTYDSCPNGIGKLCSSASLNAQTSVSYDSLGRPGSSTRSVANGPSFSSSVSYDPVTGRVDTTTYPSGVQVKHQYTALGFLESVRLNTAVQLQPQPDKAGGSAAAATTLAAGTLLWRAGRVNAWGAAEQQFIGPAQLEDLTGFHPAVGRITSRSLSKGATRLVDQSYTWDHLGNLNSRTDRLGAGAAGAVHEQFHYDNINRLSKYQVDLPAVADVRTVELKYNAIGNLLSKSDVGNYSYRPSGPGSEAPHAVRGINGASLGAVLYQYDANGNLTSADGGKYSCISYTSFNMVAQASKAACNSGDASGYTWLYDENHQRFKETRKQADGATRVTWYLHPDNAGGLGFEQEDSQDASGSKTSYRHYLNAGGQTLGVLVTHGQANGQQQASKLEFWHKDHLGSLIATSDHQGLRTAAYAYDPFGKRREVNGTYDEFGNIVVDWNAGLNHGTDRGFTGHEHLDDIGIVNMNGRIYDAHFGRFMQADPLIQSPDQLQSYNRYSYCFGNPLNCTDPSGFKFLGVEGLRWHEKIGFAGAAIHDPIGYYTALRASRTELGYQVGNIAIGVVSVFCGPWAPACAAGGTMMWSRMAGNSFDQSLKSAAFAAASAYVNTQIGNNFAGFGAEGATAQSIFANTLAHGYWGCFSSAVQGGECGSGFASGFAGAAFSNYGGGLHTNNIVIDTMTHAVVGGLTSVVSGGQFWDGARGAAFGYLFNSYVHDMRTRGGYGSAKEGEHLYFQWTEVAQDCAAGGCSAALSLFSSYSAPGFLMSPISFEPGGYQWAFVPPLGYGYFADSVKARWNYVPVGRIIQTLGTDGSITNTTTWFHGACCGSVTRSPLVVNDRLYIFTIGVGTNPQFMVRLNEVAGAKVFRELDMQLRRASGGK